MTQILTEEIRCPVCGKSFTIELYGTINVSLDPSLKVTFLNHEINHVACPKCKVEEVVPYPLLYHDMDSELMVSAVWNDELNWEQEETAYKDLQRELNAVSSSTSSYMGTYTHRLVFDYNQLVEKIRIFDSGLDDRIIEYLKFLYVGSDQKAAGRMPKILFSHVEGDKLMFVNIHSNTSLCMARKQYDDILNNQGVTDSLSASFKDAYYVNVNRLLAISQTPEAYLNLGYGLAETGRLQEATEAFQKAIGLKADYAEAYVGLGWAYARLENREEAIKAYQEAIRIKPDLADAHHYLGLTYQHLKRYQEAVEAFERATQINPDYLEAHRLLSYIQLNLGNYEQVLEGLKQVSPYQPR